MAYVTPNGIIQLMKGINLDNRYMHTIYFANKSAQNGYFTSKVTHTFNNQMYTRHNSNAIRINIACDAISDCTYLRFQNKLNGRYYYAFIIGIDYINENVTQVVFEIDVMQTWFIQNGTLRPCYIERQHVNSDTFGTNLEAEPVGSDVYDFTEINVAAMANDFVNYNIVWCTTEEPNADMMVRDGIVCGATYNTVQSTGLVSFKNELYLALGSWDKNEQKAEVVDMFMFPSVWSNAGDNSKTYHVIHDGKFDNYTPKNNKLHSYPYSSLYITTNDGESADYKWEYFDGDIVHSETGAQFNLNATVVGGGYIELHPSSYNGVAENYDAKIVMQNFPKISWNYDAYQAWIAAGGQYKTSYEQQMVQKKGGWAIFASGFRSASSAAESELAVATQPATTKRNKPTTDRTAQITTQAAVSSVNAIANIEQTALGYEEARSKIAFEFKDARYEPNILLGSQVPNVSVGKKYLRYRFYKMHIRDDEAKRIDDFFSVYGYAINKVETPHLTGRKYWNFIKTRNAEIAGDMPASAKAAIGKIFDGGIFFWKNGDNVGNFAIETSNGSIDNPIV